MMSTAADLLSSDRVRATAAAEVVRDSCDATALQQVVERLVAEAADLDSARDLVLALLEACSAIGDPSALGAVAILLDKRPRDAEVADLAVGAVTILAGSEAPELLARRIAAGTSPEVESAARRTVGKPLRDALKKLDLPRPPRSRDELWQELAGWAFTADEAHDLADVDAAKAHRLLGWAAREVGLSTVTEWDAAADYFEAENFHSLVEPARARASRGR